MATVHELVYETASVFAGEMNEGEAALLDRLCSAAEAQITARLRSDVTVADCQDTFVCAAAWMALAAYGCGQTADGAASFTAGDLTVTRSAGTIAALMGQAELLMTPYLSTGFAFLGVRS